MSDQVTTHGPVPVNAAWTVVDWPAQIVALPLTVAVGNALTVKAAALEVAAGLQVPLTTQSKVAPESPPATPVRVKVGLVAPLIVPPLLMFEPFFCHW